MASSAKIPDLVGDTHGGTTLDSSHNPDNKLFTYASFAKAINNSQLRKPFVIPSNTTDGSDGWSNQTTFLEAIDQHSVVIDCSQFIDVDFKQSSLPIVLREQFPEAVSLRFRSIGRLQKLVEISFPDELSCNSSLKKHFKLEDKTIVVCKTLAKTCKVIRIGISNLPHLPVDLLSPRLLEVFSAYGEVLNMGIYVSKEGGWLTGRGYATIKQESLQKYPESLSPQIEYEKDIKLHIVYSGMKPVCSECHVDDHIRANCPKFMPKKKACHRCSSLEHLVAECPSAPWNRNKRSKGAFQPLTTAFQFKPSIPTTRPTVRPLGEFVQVRKRARGNSNGGGGGPTKPESSTAIALSPNPFEILDNDNTDENSMLKQPTEKTRKPRCDPSPSSTTKNNQGSSSKGTIALMSSQNGVQEQSNEDSDMNDAEESQPTGFEDDLQLPKRKSTDYMDTAFTAASHTPQL